MKKISKRSYLLVVLLLSSTMYLNGCQKEKIETQGASNSISNIKIDEENAKAISIANTEITNISNLDESDTVTKIENIGSFYVSNIWLEYEELDLNKNLISNSQTFLDLTLLPGDSSSISFPHKEYTNSIKIISYGYETEGNLISINLKNESIKIKENFNKIENSKAYEVLTLSEIYKESGNENSSVNMMKVKNSSEKDLGNISIKIGELKKDGEYIAVNHLPAYNVLKPSEEIEIEIPVSTDAEKLKILGYSYDDIKEKANIDIDLKSNRVKINK
ncbi:MAG: hypothetical protein ACRC3Y_00945 [Romboutsia sp.]|uniref:hypothetical protein n=1 Tax=Romboutsia sp. TaxID=1965302 RepID=UPI003F3C96DA